jgi:hypothetical protein
MRKILGDLLRENYPQSCSIAGVPVFGLGLLAINFLKLSSIKVADTILQSFSYLGLLLLVIFALVVLFETIAKLVPVIRNLIAILLVIPQLLSRAYLWIVGTLIRGAVVAILEEKGNFVSDSFILRKRGVDKDDDYWGRIINFGDVQRLELVVEPSTGTKYWRLGLKFSQNEVFTSARYGKNFPLFHLTKDTGEDTLKIHYYNENGAREPISNNIIIENYENEKVTMVAETERGPKESLKITVLDKNNKTVFDKDLNPASHKFAQLFAWGDKNDYAINIKNYIKSKK